MRMDDIKMREIETDLGINSRFVKGQDIQVRNCWHFYTDGNALDAMFCDEADFRDGMNRIYVTLQCFDVVILAFVLMDTHIHFVLHGRFDECNRFVHEYIRRTSGCISFKYGEKKKLKSLPISHQRIDTSRYLEAAVCYVIKNPTEGGLPSMFYDYPWSSGALYFRQKDYWTSGGGVSSAGEMVSGGWMASGGGVAQKQSAESNFSARKLRGLMKTRHFKFTDIKMIDGLIFPAEYVAFEIVEELFRTHRNFLFFLGTTRSADIESRGGYISHLSLPDREIRQHRNELCIELFGSKNTNNLNTRQRVDLARRLKSKFNSSTKQIARICGLKYDEIKDLI